MKGANSKMNIRYTCIRWSVPTPYTDCYRAMRPLYVPFIMSIAELTAVSAGRAVCPQCPPAMYSAACKFSGSRTSNIDDDFRVHHGWKRNRNMLPIPNDVITNGVDGLFLDLIPTWNWRRILSRANEYSLSESYTVLNSMSSVDRMSVHTPAIGEVRRKSHYDTQL